MPLRSVAQRCAAPAHHLQRRVATSWCSSTPSLFQRSSLLSQPSCAHRSFASVPSASPASSAATATCSSSDSSSESSGYASIHSKLTSALHPTFLQLEDTSGGCGTFYRLVIAAPAFDGLSLVAQHRRVKEAIKEDIAAIHGLTIHTMTDAQYREKKAEQAQNRS